MLGDRLGSDQLSIRRPALGTSGRTSLPAGSYLAPCAIYAGCHFASESLDLTDLRVGEHDFTFSDLSSVGVNHFKISFSGVKSGLELRGVAETKIEGKLAATTTGSKSW